MFLHSPDPVDYKDPWISSYAQRIVQLCAGRRRIAYFYELPDTSTFRYRAFNPGFSLAANPECGTSAAWFDHRDLQADDSFIELADALVICRVRYNAAVARMVARAKLRKIPVLFDCDDLVFDPRRVHLLIDSLNYDHHDESGWNYWFGWVARLSATLGLCDGIITTNDFLASRAKEHDQRLRTAVVPNYLQRDQQSLSERLYEAKRDCHWARDGRIHIGYFSGSPSHARDFAVAAPALTRLMEKDPRIVLRVVGFLDLGPEFSRFRDRIEVFPLQDFLNLQRLISEVEINIAPLQDNIFTNCKSELKFFEAAICGTLTLASPTYAFQRSIKHGATGFLAHSHNWDYALKEIVNLVENKDHYTRIAEEAFKFSKENYSWNKHADSIIKSVFC